VGALLAEAVLAGSHDAPVHADWVMKQAHDVTQGQTKFRFDTQTPRTRVVR
jgi:hypothetical protein